MRSNFRFLETGAEEFDYVPVRVPLWGRWKICGLRLPNGILPKVGRDNAVRRLRVAA